MFKRKYHYSLVYSTYTNENLTNVGEFHIYSKDKYVDLTTLNKIREDIKDNIQGIDKENTIVIITNIIFLGKVK